MIKHILFDLDGTLLPMDQEEFIRYYFPLLSRRFTKYGVGQEQFVKAIWSGMGAMAANDGSRTNEAAFWACFEVMIGVKQEEVKDDTLDFYNQEFNQAIAATQPTLLADRIVKGLKAKGVKVYLATNPIFPRCATMSRIRWAGLDASDFEEITTYEDYSYCKPNVKYYEEILKRNRLNPEECLMVGNDVSEDLPVRSLGVKTFLVTDCLENAKQLPIDTDEMGSLEEFYEKYVSI